MSAAGPWTPPEARPPEFRGSRDGRLIKTLDALTGGPRFTPAPLLRGELAPWSKPAAGVAFSLHPLGTLELYSRAIAVLDASGLLDQLRDAEQRSALENECWRIVVALYEPGRSVRAAMDDAIEERVLRPNLTGIQDQEARVNRTRLANVAGWAVFRAACDWTRETP